MIRSCSVDDLATALGSGGSPQVIDVREALEYDREHVPGTSLTPLSSFSRHIGTLVPDKSVYVLCRSGNRAKKAAAHLLKLGFSDVRIVDGGVLAWAKAGKEVVRGEDRGWSIERQVRFTAGLLVAVGVALGLSAHSAFASLSGFVGLGLAYSAVTDSCAMGLILSRMPWNRARAASANGACGCLEEGSQKPDARGDGSSGARHS